MSSNLTAIVPYTGQRLSLLLIAVAIIAARMIPRFPKNVRGGSSTVRRSGDTWDARFPMGCPRAFKNVECTPVECSALSPGSIPKQQRPWQRHRIQRKTV